MTHITNSDLARERLNCPFDFFELTTLLDGGKEGTDKRKTLEDVFLNSGVRKYVKNKSLWLYTSRGGRIRQFVQYVDTPNPIVWACRWYGHFHGGTGTN